MPASPRPTRHASRTPAFAAVLLAGVLALPARAQISPPPLDPRVDPAQFRVTVFAEGLNFPRSMQELSDGSLLVATSRPNPGGSYFNSVGELVRLVDADGDGHADGPPQVLYTGLPGALQSVRVAGDLVFVTTAQAGAEAVTVLRQGATPADMFSQVGSIRLNFPAGWEHTSYALATREVPGQANTFELYFNVGSARNDIETGDAITVGGLITGTANEASIYRVTVQDLGGSVAVSGLTQIANGLRNAAGFDFQPSTGDLYLQDNGIDNPANRIEPLSADELNVITAANLGGAGEDFGFSRDYIEYRTGNRVGSGGIQPVVAFQPIPDPFTGAESEGAVEIAFAPAGFPAGLNNGVFIGFHGQFNLGGPANEENPVVFYDLDTGEYFHFIPNTAPQIGHIDGLLATADSLFLADLASTGNLFTPNVSGVIYQIKALGVPIPEPASLALTALGGLGLALSRRRRS